MKKLYTICVEFRDCSYVQQVRANNCKRALFEWSSHFPENYMIDDLTKSDFEEVKDYLKNPNEMPIEDTINVWRVGCSIGENDDSLELLCIETNQT